MPHEKWIVCQIGAREHYAIPRALHQSGVLQELITDFWIGPSSGLVSLPQAKRLRDRYHPDLSGAAIRCHNVRMLLFEFQKRVQGLQTWGKIIARNQFFQNQAIAELKRFTDTHKNDRISLFSYSYAAKDLFRFAKERGWTTVLGQIDPGPVEEGIVQQEFVRLGFDVSRWQPAPAQYWSDWIEETKLADRIIVNSTWSKQCLTEKNIPESKLEIIPLVYASPKSPPVRARTTPSTFSFSDPLRVLFLGQVNIRKGVPRLLDAMSLLETEPVELILAGPTDLNLNRWLHLRNIRFVGSIPRSQVQNYYLNSDVFILPTLSDGYALTQLEALAYGLPVIASKNCGQAVKHGKNGLILDSTEPQVIADTIRQFLMNPIAVSDTGHSFGLQNLANALISIAD